MKTANRQRSDPNPMDHTEPARPELTPRWLPAALVVVVLATFGGAVSFGWINLDDDINVTENPFLNPVTLTHLRHLWTTSYERLYVPVAYTAFAAQAVLSRGLFPGDPSAPPDPRLFHAVSILLHVVNVLLVWRILLWLSPHAGWAAAAGAALFGVHPIQAESVAWISEQRGLIASCLSLVAMLLHFKAGNTDLATSRRRCLEAAAVACFSLGLLSKPSVVTVPLLLLLLDTLVLQHSARTSMTRLLPWAVPAVTVSLVTRTLQPAGCTADVELWARPFVAGDAMRFYATQIVWPRSLGIDYGRTPLAVLASFPACIAAMAMWAIVLVPCLLPRFQRWRICLLVSIVPLIPVLGFAPFLFQNFSTVADRYAYLAMLGPALALTWALPTLAAVVSARAAGFCAAAVIFAMAVMALVQTLTWRDSFTVSRNALRVNPGSFFGACNLGAAMLSADRPENAILVLKEAIDRGPRHLNARLCLGIALERTGRLDEAAQYYRSVLFIDPRHAKALNYLGVVRARQGHLDIATSLFEEALEADPSYSDARHNLDRARRMLRPASAGESGP